MADAMLPGEDQEAPCEWCGKDVSLEATDCVIIHCNACDPRRYHESCLEKMVGNIKFAKSSRTASKGVMGLRDRHAPCPRGKGPGSLSHGCPGRVEKVIIARMHVKKAAPAPLPPLEEVQPRGKQKKQKAPHVPPPTAPKPQKPKAPPVNYQRPMVVARAPAFPAYVSSSVQALEQTAAPAAPPPGAAFVEDEAAAAAKANKAALKNLKRRAKQRQQQGNGDENGSGQGANGDGASSMGPQASGEWEDYSGFGGVASRDGMSVTDASGEYYGGEYDDDLALAMRLQQEENEAAAAAARARQQQQQPQRPPAETWPPSNTHPHAQPPPPPPPQPAQLTQPPAPAAASMGAFSSGVGSVVIPEGPTWRCGPHPPRNAQEKSFVEGPGAPDWPRSAHEWLWFLYGVIPA